jgi:WD40 repeat protein
MLASLGAVCFFVAALGAVFLPPEAAQLAHGPHVSITHCIVPSGGRPAISLFWDIPRSGKRGWHNRLGTHDLNSAKPLVNLASTDLHPQCLAAGPTDSQLLIGDMQGRIFLVDLQQPKNQPRLCGLQGDGAIVGLACMLDGRYVLSHGLERIYAWDLAKGTLVWERNISVNCLAPSDDCRTLFCGTASGEVLELSLDSGATLRRLRDKGFSVSNVTLSPDGKQVAAVGDCGEVLVMRRDDLAIVFHAQRRSQKLAAAGRVVAYSPCGKVLVTSSPDNMFTLAVWDAATGELHCELHGHRGAITGGAFAPSGTFYSWGTDGTIRTWDVRTGLARLVSVISAPAPFI